MGLILDTFLQRRWKLRSLIIIALILVLPRIAIYAYNTLRAPGVAIMSYNYGDRPIGSFWVNDFWGGNIAVMGGGGIMCCRSISGDKAHVAWVLSMSKTQEKQGARFEEHELEMPMPKRKPNDDTLHVYFFPGNKIELVWGATVLNPLEQNNQLAPYLEKYKKGADQ
ncbi:DUF3304 domain-containing protein [Pseudomonas sp. SDO528_S397]